MSLPAVPSVKLNDGTSIPAIGYGLGTTNFGKDATAHIVDALNAGYRYIDAAQQYANSKSIGDALKQWGGKREDVYILTKVGQEGVDATQNDPEVVLKKLLKEMNVDYVDLYLIHNPFYVEPLGFPAFWAKMEALVDAGLTRSIGVSNFRTEDFAKFEGAWRIPPAVNQIEYNPYIWHAANIRRLRAYQDKHDIKFETYGPLNSLFRSTGGPVDAVVKDIAARRGYTEAQVLLLWAAQHSGGAVVTTSTNTQRQREQLAALTLDKLTDADVEAIAKAGKGRFFRKFQQKVWDTAEP
ncbi:hypothetical protein Q5752_005570 [Cryptotrichosporon argae]